MVRSPVTFNFPVPADSARVDLKVMVGYFSTSKKCGLRRSLSRIWTRVFTVFASIVASIEALVGSDGSKLTVPLAFSNWPRTVEIPKCFTENCAAVWLGSICQVCGSAMQIEDKPRNRKARIVLFGTKFVLFLVIKVSVLPSVRSVLILQIFKLTSEKPLKGRHQSE